MPNPHPGVWDAVVSEPVSGLWGLVTEDWVTFFACLGFFSSTYCVYRLGLSRRRKRAEGAKGGNSETSSKEGEEGKLRDDEIKHRAWFCSCLSSFVVSSISLYVVKEGMQANFQEQWFATETPLARFAVIYFISFLLFDLLAGFFDYAKYMELLSGWVHHSMFIWLGLRSLNDRCSNYFGFHMIEEIPTFLLSLGKLDIYRTDFGFGGTFFLFRVGTHAITSFNALLNWPKDSIPKKYLYLSFVSLALHVHWMRLWVLGMMRRHRKKKQQQEEENAKLLQKQE